MHGSVEVAVPDLHFQAVDVRVVDDRMLQLAGKVGLVEASSSVALVPASRTVIAGRVSVCALSAMQVWNPAILRDSWNCRVAGKYLACANPVRRTATAEGCEDSARAPAFLPGSLTDIPGVALHCTEQSLPVLDRALLTYLFTS